MGYYIRGDTWFSKFHCLPDQIYFASMVNFGISGVEQISIFGNTILSGGEPASHISDSYWSWFRGRIKTSSKGPIAFPILKDKGLLAVSVLLKQVAC